ncbi:FlgD immunoglobulin-like domain containing protein, partial [Bacteroidota bacterium]
NYLSSITSDSSGHLFISCPKLNEIYRMRISDQAYWIFAKDNGLVKPNGILLEKENNRIVVIDDSPGSSLIHAVSLLDSTVSTLASTSFDRPDGIVRDKYGCYYVGGYYLPGLYKFDADFSLTPEMFFAGSHMVYPTYDESDHSLLVTYYNDNTWVRVPLTPTGIGQFKQPSEFIMYQVSPNPFKSLATIKFELQKRALARMDVYDTIGVLLKTLMNDERGPGTYSMKWDGTDNTGNIVSDGTYYIILTVNGVSQTTKAILIK